MQFITNKRCGRRAGRGGGYLSFLCQNTGLVVTNSTGVGTAKHTTNNNILQSADGSTWVGMYCFCEYEWMHGASLSVWVGTVENCTRGGDCKTSANRGGNCW